MSFTSRRRLRLSAAFAACVLVAAPVAGAQAASVTTTVTQRAGTLLLRGTVTEAASGASVRAFVLAPHLGATGQRLRWSRSGRSRAVTRSGRFLLRVTPPRSARAVRVVLISGGRVVARSAPTRIPGASRTTPKGSAPRAVPGVAPAAQTPAATLSPGEQLAPGQELRSPNGLYRLVMQDSDGNLVLYDTGKALWSTTPSGRGARAVMQSDGNFVVYNDQKATWSTVTGGFGAARLVLQDDGNLVLYQGSRPIWARTAGYVGNQLVPGQSLTANEFARSADGHYRLVMQASDGNLVLYRDGSAVWSTGATGAGSRAVMQEDGNFVVYNANAARWASATGRFPGAYLLVQDDGNVVIYADGHPLWASREGYVGDRLTAGQSLTPGAYLYSPSRQLRLVMQADDGNLVIYGPSGPVYAFNTAGHPGAAAVMQADGNFVVYDRGTALAHTQTGGLPGAYLRLQDDGNLVVYRGTSALWSRTSGLLPAGGAVINGPVSIAGAAIAERAETYANGAYGGQCLAFVADMIAAAGGPRWYFGNNTGTYQGQWAARATEISGIANARRGDIIQWGGGAGGNLLHTAIVTQAGANPSIIDSNWGVTVRERVSRGSFNSRNQAGSVYRIWRVGRAS